MNNNYTILHDLTIHAPMDKVFESIGTCEGLNHWWTETCEGDFRQGWNIQLGFTPQHQWRAKVVKHFPNRECELEMFNADVDWDGTRVHFELKPAGDSTRLQFAHSGWYEANEHFRVSSYCWANYLRILKNYLEKGTRVPYAERDSN